MKALAMTMAALLVTGCATSTSGFADDPWGDTEGKSDAGTGRPPGDSNTEGDASVVTDGSTSTKEAGPTTNDAGADVIAPPPPPACGDGKCNGTENCSTCSRDCGACPASCGDKVCNGTETCQICPQDCGNCPPRCGDGTCNGTETCSTCAQDCGSCPVTGGWCGDRTCQSNESQTSCPIDCGQPASKCSACSAQYQTSIGDKGWCTSNGHLMSRCIQGCTADFFCVDIGKSCSVVNGLAACR